MEGLVPVWLGKATTQLAVVLAVVLLRMYQQHPLLPALKL
jgi:hypothetical protein